MYQMIYAPRLLTDIKMSVSQTITLYWQECQGGEWVHLLETYFTIHAAYV